MIDRINGASLNEYHYTTDDFGKITIYFISHNERTTIVSGINLNEAFLFLSGMLEVLNA